MAQFGRRPGDFLFASRRNSSRCISTRQYSRTIKLDSKCWIGLENFRHPLPTSDKSCLDLSPNRQPQAVQLLLGHTNIESTFRYLGIEVDNALVIAEQVDV